MGQPAPTPRSNVPPEKKLLQNPEYLWTVALLAVVMLGGAIAIAILDKWRRRQVLPGRWDNAGHELNSFRDMLDSGEITHSEYEKIRDKVASKIKLDSGLKKLPTPPAPTGESSPPSAPSGPAPGDAPGSEKT
ncbi:MAG: hypothetical protein U0798_20745 [Gemmataceae bacterium]